MYLFDAIRQRARVIVGPILGISLVVYFAYHLVQGDRGLMAWLRLTQQISEARTTLATVEAQRQPLEHRVGLMREHIDPDLLDETVRADLNLVGPNEVVIFNSPAR
ncbi:MAG TPA: septum formation initiator family protein [Stellaceae bacterium]|jgi:cell division protein FtsB